MLCLILLQRSAFRLRSLQYYCHCHCGLDRCSLPVPCLLASTSWVRSAFLTAATPQHQDLRLEKFYPSTIPPTPPAHDSSSVSQFLWASRWRPCHPRRQALLDLLTFWRILQPFVTCLPLICLNILLRNDLPVTYALRCWLLVPSVLILIL